LGPDAEGEDCKKEIPRKQSNDPIEGSRLSGCWGRFLYRSDGTCESDTHETVADIYGEAAKAQHRCTMFGVNQLVQIVALQKHQESHR